MSQEWARDQLVRRSLKVSQTLCFVTMWVAGLTAVGWIFDVPLLTQWLPSRPAMLPNTALGLFLGALGVLLARGGASTILRRSTALVASSIVLLLGVLTLGEHTFGWDIGIDRIFGQARAVPGQRFPGRLSLLASFNFALLGAAVLGINLPSRRPIHLAQAVAIVVGAAAAGALSGDTSSGGFGGGIFFGFPIHAASIGLAVHTALGFIFLVIALFCARPNDGMMTLVTSDTGAGAIARQILVGGIFALPLVGTLTRVGVVAGWYEVGVQVSLFALATAGLTLGTTWWAARKSEHQELLARAACEALGRANSEIKRAREEVENVARAVKLVSDAVADLPESSVLAVLQTIALKAQDLTSAEFAAVGIGSDSDRPFEFWAFAGLSHDQATAIGPPPKGAGLLGLVAKESLSVRLADLREHPAFSGFPAHHPIMTSLIGVPIRSKGRAFGSIYVTNKRGADEFTQQDQEVIEMLAEAVGGAIETARLYSAEGLARAWLEAVVDQMPEGVVLMDAEGRVSVENRYIQSIAAGELSQTVDRFGNRLTLDLRHPSGEALSPDDFPLVKALLDKTTTREQELVARRADGRLVPLLVSAAPIRAANGEFAGATMILEDVTTLKELEHLREEWASIVAHDLQQPIHAILLRSDLLLRGHLSGEQVEHVLQVRITTKLLSRLVNDLLDASQLEANRMRIVLTRLDVGGLVRDIVGRYPEARARMRIGTPVDHRLFVRADAQRLEQIVSNLLSNALKFARPHTTIEIEVRKLNSHAQVSVTNQGSGIAADELTTIFERYARSRATRANKTKGLGLGLYIAKGLVTAQGGRIWAESTTGEATAIRFTIPLDGAPVPVTEDTPGLGAIEAPA